MPRLASIAELLRHFLDEKRFFLVPLLVVVVLASGLLVLTGGLSYVAPFVYALF
jgi:hypothetical protein